MAVIRQSLDGEQSDNRPVEGNDDAAKPAIPQMKVEDVGSDPVVRVRMAKPSRPPLGVHPRCSHCYMPWEWYGCTSDLCAEPSEIKKGDRKGERGRSEYGW